MRSRAWNDGKVTAHHGIIPTLEPANLSAMSEKERAVYRLIRAHYLAQFLPHHEFDRTVADLSCGQQKLVATGKQVVAKGWRLVPAEPQADEDGDGAARSQVLPALRDGMACQIAGADIKALKTMPPKPYTQGELIKAMKGVARFVTDPRLKQKLKDTTGIGTEATRANIISGLIARGYIVKKGRSIRASDAAFTLIDAVPAAIADRHHRRLGTGAGHDRGRTTHPGCVHRQAGCMDFAVDRAVRQHVPVHQGALGPACPQCGAPTRQRTGKSGPFWSCSRYPDCKGTLPVETGTSSVVPRAHARAAAKAPDRPPFPVSRARHRRRGPCSACPAGRPARNAFLSVCASRSAAPAAGSEGSFSANRTPRVLPVRISSARCEGPPMACLCEPPGDPSWSAVFGAGARRRKTGSLCARMCARRCRPQPRHGPGVIAG